MSAVPDPVFQFRGPLEEPAHLRSGGVLRRGENDTRPDAGGRRGQGVYWRANFIPNMNSWDKLVPFWGRGAGGYVVRVGFRGGDMDCHMSVFDPQLYKKAHKHGPGRVIVIPKGEG